MHARLPAEQAAHLGTCGSATAVKVGECVKCRWARAAGSRGGGGRAHRNQPCSSRRTEQAHAAHLDWVEAIDDQTRL